MMKITVSLRFKQYATNVFLPAEVCTSHDHIVIKITQYNVTIKQVATPRTHVTSNPLTEPNVKHHHLILHYIQSTDRGQDYFLLGSTLLTAVVNTHTRTALSARGDIRC